MAFTDLPKVKPEKDIKPLLGMSEATARKRFSEKCSLKKQLCKQLAKCENDLMKYYLTYTR